MQKNQGILSVRKCGNYVNIFSMKEIQNNWQDLNSTMSAECVDVWLM